MSLFEKVCELEEESIRFGFRWENSAQIMAQIRSECEEIEEHLSLDERKIPNLIELQGEIGDLIHAAFSLCIFYKLDPQETLLITLQKYEKRFNAVKELAKEQGLQNLEGHDFDELMEYWSKAKKLVDKAKS